MNTIDKVRAILSIVYGGEHNIPNRCLKDGGYYVEANVDSSRFATFDFSGLTAIVVAAHDYCIRIQIRESGPRRIKLMFSERKRTGGVSERHPTLAGAIESIRSSRWYRTDLKDIAYFVDETERRPLER